MKQFLTIFLLGMSAAFAADPVYPKITITGTAALPSATTVGGVALGDTATLNVGTGSNQVAAGDLSGARQSLGIVSNIDTQSPYTSAKISAWTSSVSGSPPVRMMILGDSLSTGLDVGPLMGRTGAFRGAGPLSTTGTVRTFGSGTNIADYSVWINGRYDEIYPSSSATYTLDGSATGDIVGDRIFVAYVATATGSPTAVLEYSSNSGTTYSVSGTASTFNATQLGVPVTGTVSASNSPQYRIRVTNTGTGTVKLVAWGIYQSSGGGVIDMQGIGNYAGIDVVNCVTTGTATLSPIWTALAPDLVLSCWADAAANWETSGDFRTLYSRLKTAYNATDYVIISANPAADETGREASRIAQWNWAQEFNESYVDGWSPFRGYTVANAKGQMQDTVHLNAVGCDFRNDFLWPSLSIGKRALGRSPVYGVSGAIQFADNDYTPSWQMRGLALGAGANMFSSNPIGTPGISLHRPLFAGGLATRWDLSVDASGFLNFGVPGLNIFQARFSTNSGIHPTTDGNKLGLSGNAWAIFAKSFSGDKTVTAAATVGAQTINKPIGSVNFAAAATSLVVTNSLVTASSVIMATVQTDDLTLVSVKAVPGVGSFTLVGNAAATTETRVAFVVFN